MQSVTIEIGGIATKIACSDAALSGKIRGLYPEFLSTKKPGILIDARITDSEMASEDSVIEKNNFFELFSTDYTAKLDLEKNTGTISIHSQKIDSIKYFLQLVYSVFGLKHEAFFLHSCAFEKNGKAFVFFGEGGSGKTTVAKANSSQALVINDDLNFIRRIGKKFFVFGNPFYIQTFGAGNIKSEIGAVYALRKDTRNFVAKMEGAKALCELFNSIRLGSKSRQAGKKILELCADLVESHECREFHFAKEKPFLEAVE